MIKSNRKMVNESTMMSNTTQKGIIYLRVTKKLKIIKSTVTKIRGFSAVIPIFCVLKIRRKNEDLKTFGTTAPKVK